MKPSDGELKTASGIPDTASIAKTVSVIIEYAIKSRASDIHVEPRADTVQVRYRIDGILHETMTLPKEVLSTVVAYIKTLASLNSEDLRSPQEGRFSFKLPDKSLILRVSTLPVIDGEKIVMRLLDENAHPLSLEELGLEGENLSRVARGIHEPHGLILVTGPAGTGKTTTLYSILTLLNAPGVNISTIEDPVEYRLPGINQTQVNSKSGITLAAGLRSLLGQDPNVVMAGEIRDSETADLAIQGALTGHVILSGLHTDDTATAIVRLLDMKIAPFLVASTVKLVIAQRLVRRICASCRISYVPSADEIATIKTSFQLDAALNIFRGKTAEPKKTPITPVPTTHTLMSSPAIAGNMKIVEPVHDLMKTKTIMQRIADDPNIINRTMAEAEAAQTKKPAVPPPVSAKSQAPAQTTPAKLNGNEFMLYKAGPGCDKCSHNGYIGRIGIFEVMEINDIVTKMIVSRAHADMIEEASVREGMITLSQDGLLKCLRGETTIEEVLRVAHEIDR